MTREARQSGAALDCSGACGSSPRRQEAGERIGAGRALFAVAPRREPPGDALWSDGPVKPRPFDPAGRDRIPPEPALLCSAAMTRQVFPPASKWLYPAEVTAWFESRPADTAYIVWERTLPASSAARAAPMQAIAATATKFIIRERYRLFSARLMTAKR